MDRFRKFSVSVLFCVLLLALLAACGGEADSSGAAQAPAGEEYPHSETVFMFSGMSNTPTDMSPLSVNPNFPLSQVLDCFLLYEPLFMMNMVIGDMEPLVGDSYTWIDDLTLEVKMNPNVTFNDGQKATSADVVYSCPWEKIYHLLEYLLE